MKRRGFIYFIVLAVMMSCGQGKDSKELSSDIVNNPNTASGKNTQDNLPVFKFTEETHDFGKVIQGEKVTYSFRFKNTGKSDLLISNASASCGCTVPEYPKNPIHPGEEGMVKVAFNTEGKKGIQAKTVTLMANTQPNTRVLTIKAEVYVPEGK